MAKIVKAGVANLTLNEKGFLKLLTAKSAALRGLVSRRLRTAKDNAEPVENRSKEKCDEYDRKIG